MSAAASSSTRLVKRMSRWSQPATATLDHTATRERLSAAQSAPKAILIGAKESLRPISARHHLTATLSHLAFTVNTAIKSPWRPPQHPHLISRAFLHWRLSDDGPRASRIGAMDRHPKPFTLATWQAKRRTKRAADDVLEHFKNVQSRCQQFKRVFFV